MRAEVMPALLMLLTSAFGLECYYYRVRADELLTPDKMMKRNCSSVATSCLKIISRNEFEGQSGQSGNAPSTIEGRCAFTQHECEGRNGQTPGTSYSSAITMSPQLERQFSQDFQDFLNGIDLSIDNCRDLLGNHWDFNLFDNVDTGEEQEQVQPEKPELENNVNNYAMPFNNGQQQLRYPGPRLALEGGPLTTTSNTSNYNQSPQVEVLDETHPETHSSLEFPDSSLMGGEDLLFPNTPVLLTPCSSPRP